MANPIYPCLWMDNQAKEAALFYCSVFRGTVENPSVILSESQLVVSFQLLGNKFIALNGGPVFQKNPSISFFVICQSDEELETRWKKLTENGEVLMPLDTYPWSEKYGWCQDKYGVNWQLIISDNYGDASVVPCLMFTQHLSGKAEEAIGFYTSAFSNSGIRWISRYGKDEGDEEGYINHGQFFLDGKLFSAMDSSGPHPFIFNEGISLVVECETQIEIDYYWNLFIAEGTESQCGWLKDKFGVSWQIIPSILEKLMNDPDRAPRVTQAFLQMKKFDIEKLLKA